MPPRPPRRDIPEIFKKNLPFTIKNKQVSISDYKKAIGPLLSIIPQLEKTLPSSGNVIVGESIYPLISQRVHLFYGLQSIKKHNPEIFEKIRDNTIKDKLDDIYIDENGNIHSGSGSTTTPIEPTTPTTDPAEERRREGRQFARKLINLPWTSVPFPFIDAACYFINLGHYITSRLVTVLGDDNMRAGFFEGIRVSSSDPSYESSSRWLKVFNVLGINTVMAASNEAITFGPFTGLLVQEMFGVPHVNKKTDSPKVINSFLYNGPKPSDGEKEVSAGDAVSALLDGDWDHDWFLTTVTMSHEQTQLFGKGCKFLGPWMIEQGRKLQESSGNTESDSDSETARQIVGTILVVLGNVLQYVGQAILDCDNGNGIVLYTNFWAGFILTGVPIVWPESR